MAPMAGGIADRKQDRPVGARGLGNRLLAPRPPVHRIAGMLQQVGAGLVGQPVAAFAHGVGSPRLPSLLISRTRALRPSFSASNATGSAATRISPARPAQPDGPEAIAGSPPAGWASSCRAGRTSSSSMVMNQSAARPTTGQVTGEISRQARPPITVSALPLAAAGLPYRLLWNQQSALSGSTTMKLGRVGSTAQR